MVYMTPPSNYPSDNTPSPSYSPSSPALSVSPHTPPSINVHSTGVSYALYASPHLPPDDYMDPSNQASSQAHIPLVANGDEAMQVHHWPGFKGVDNGSQSVSEHQLIQPWASWTAHTVASSTTSCAQELWTPTLMQAWFNINPPLRSHCPSGLAHYLTGLNTGILDNCFGMSNSTSHAAGELWTPVLMQAWLKSPGVTRDVLWRASRIRLPRGGAHKESQHL